MFFYPFFGFSSEESYSTDELEVTARHSQVQPCEHQRKIISLSRSRDQEFHVTHHVIKGLNSVDALISLFHTPDFLPWVGPVTDPKFQPPSEKVTHFCSYLTESWRSTHCTWRLFFINFLSFVIFYTWTKVMLWKPWGWDLSFYMPHTHLC